MFPLTLPEASAADGRPDDQQLRALPLRDRDNVASLDELESRLRDCLPPGCRLLCTSPLEVGHKLATSHSLLVTAPAIEVLVEAELRFMQRLGHESSYP